MSSAAFVAPHGAPSRSPLASPELELSAKVLTARSRWISFRVPCARDRDENGR